MKDKNYNAPNATQKDFSATTNTSSARKQSFDFKSAEQVAKTATERDKINRRYSFDDNGGGYLGL